MKENIEFVQVFFSICVILYYVGCPILNRPAEFLKYMHKFARELLLMEMSEVTFSFAK